jgi:ubiquinone/menaquinone biosynthesis C-methylase UbiE
MASPSPAGLDSVQQAAETQFSKQSHRYGKGHILEDVSDVAEALRYVDLQPPAKALDVATGGGHTGLFLAQQGYKTTLADISSAMLSRARALAAERNLVVDTCQHPAEAFPYPDASFDLVTCRVAPHHFSSPEKFVRETARVLRPGGWFVLIDGSVPDNEPETEAWLHEVEKLRDPSHERLLAPSAWARLCSVAGLQVKVSELHPFKQPNLEWYFETAATPSENRTRVRQLIATASESVRRLLRLGEEGGKTVWWWPRLTLVARHVG